MYADTSNNEICKTHSWVQFIDQNLNCNSRMGNLRNAYRVLVGKAEGKSTLNTYA
jgi:hypothetical protein